MTDAGMFAAAVAVGVGLALASTSGASGAAAVDLQVMIPNVKPDGPVVISLYNDPNAWAAVGKPYRSATVTAVEGIASARFNAPPGRYAVMAFQDRNGDGRLDTLPFGWPAEKVGYSGGERPLFGRPAWDKADFGTTLGERTTVFVRLK